jgi:hypothetical protein
MEFANHVAMDPADVARAGAALGHGSWQRDLP